MTSVAVGHLLVGGPNMLAGHSMVFIFTGVKDVGQKTVVVTFPVATTSASLVRDAIVEAFTREGIDLGSWGSGTVCPVWEVEPSATPAFVLSATTAGSASGVSVYAPLAHIALPFASAELASEAANRLVAETSAAAANAALLVALNDDTTTAASLVQLSGQLAAAQYELDEERLLSAALVAERNALASQLSTTLSQLSAADGRADSARSAAGVATALSIVGVAAANKRSATAANAGRTDTWRKVGDR